MALIDHGGRRGTRGSGFFSNQKGAVSALIATTLVPALGMGGAAFEAAHFVKGRGQLERATEIALVASVAASRDGIFDPIMIAEEALNRSLHGSGFGTASLTLDNESDNQLVFTTSAAYETSILSIFGVDRYTIEASARLLPQVRPIAISFVMDATSSALSGGGGANAVGAFRDMLAFIDQANGEAPVSASLVPMADRVRIATGHRGWLAFDPGEEWNGCLEAREERLDQRPFALTNARPSALPFLPSNAVEGLHQSGPRRVCAEAIVEPTEDFDQLAGTLAGFSASGQGRFDIGLAWGWRMLSNGWQEPLALDLAPETRRIAVLATDGFSDIYRYEAGGVEADLYGYNRGSRVAFQNLADICTAMRQDGIELHVVFLSGNDAIADTLRGCAGDDRRYHEVFTVEDLADAYRAIALDAVRSNG